MATENSLTSLPDELVTITTDETGFRDRPLTLKSIKRMTFGCKSRPRVAAWRDDGPATEERAHNTGTSIRQLSGQADGATDLEMKLATVSVTSQTGNTAHIEATDSSGSTVFTTLANTLRETASAEFLSGPTPACELESGEGNPSAAPIPLQRHQNETGAAKGDVKEVTRCGLEDATLAKSGGASTTQKIVQLNEDTGSLCLKPLLDPIQDTVRTNLLEYSKKHLPDNIHQHITNEVILTFENEQLNITININCTLFIGDSEHKSAENDEESDDVGAAK